MRKAFEIIAGASILAAATKTKTIFKDEHAGKRHIDHGDGRHSLKMEAIRTKMNKYESVLYRGDELFPERRTIIDQLNSIFSFGADDPIQEDQPRFGAKTHTFAATGDQDSVELVNPDGTMWVGPIIMGGVTQLDVVYDTGSDWLVVESNTCTNCEGDTYNPAKSQGNPEKLSTE